MKENIERWFPMDPVYIVSSYYHHPMWRQPQMDLLMLQCHGGNLQKSSSENYSRPEVNCLHHSSYLRYLLTDKQRMLCKRKHDEGQDMKGQKSDLQRLDRH